MPNTDWDDKKLQQAILGSTSERNNALHHIFTDLSWKSMAIKYVHSKGGNEQDGEDVFQEAIILFDRNIRQHRFKGDSSLQTYFFAIVKWYWWGQFRKRRPQEEVTQLKEEQIEGPDAQLISQEKKHYLREALKQLGNRCQQILELYQLHYSMQEIAVELKLSSAEMAKKEAYSCRKKLKTFFANHPNWKNLVK